MSLKESIKQSLPAPLMTRWYAARRWFSHLGNPAGRAEWKAMCRLRESYETRNKSAAANEAIFRPDIRFFYYPGSEEQFTSFCWTSRGVHEMDSFIAETKSRRCLFDIGAFQGIFSLVFCAGGSKTAHAFEPSPQPFEVLKHNATVNPSFGIRPHNIAIGDSEGALDMNYEWQHLVATPAQAGQAPAEGSVRVPVTTMDAFCSAHGVEPDTIKIDVEGFEFQVLKGAGQTLRRARPLMFIEIHPIALTGHGVSLSAIWDYLVSLQYTILDTDRKPLVDPTPFANTNAFNIVCRPIEESAKDGG